MRSAHAVLYFKCGGGFTVRIYDRTVGSVRRSGRGSNKRRTVFDGTKEQLLVKKYFMLVTFCLIQQFCFRSIVWDIKHTRVRESRSSIVLSLHYLYHVNRWRRNVSTLKFALLSSLVEPVHQSSLNAPSASIFLPHLCCNLNVSKASKVNIYRLKPA